MKSYYQSGKELLFASCDSCSRASGSLVPCHNEKWHVIFRIAFMCHSIDPWPLEEALLASTSKSGPLLREPLPTTRLARESFTTLTLTNLSSPLTQTFTPCAISTTPLAITGSEPHVRSPPFHNLYRKLSKEGTAADRESEPEAGETTAPENAAQRDGRK